MPKVTGHLGNEGEGQEPGKLFSTRIMQKFSEKYGSSIMLNKRLKLISTKTNEE